MEIALFGWGKNAGAVCQENMRYRLYCASSLTRSLRSGRETAAGAAGFLAGLMYSDGSTEKRRPKAAGNPFFHRLRLP